MDHKGVWIFAHWWWLYLTKKERNKRLDEHLKDEKVIN